jgi:Amt family ammonium transporter
LIYGNPKQLWIQAVSIIGTASFSAVMTLVVIGITRLITGPLRIDKENEIIGLDSAFHGEHAFDIQG